MDFNILKGLIKSYRNRKIDREMFVRLWAEYQELDKSKKGVLTVNQ